ncbi:hypothetical protein CDAR_386951 [Caerostris darwini]|uniref:Uncharacterized protein n=1 Tax=Caerostris darwini TaxID=1538125 RepID=A0AAV4WNW9_9ARAC|nr:hypothetical protein CDAR_386951 [Caerostris darwini]
MHSSSACDRLHDSDQSASTVVQNHEYRMSRIISGDPIWGRDSHVALALEEKAFFRKYQLNTRDNGGENQTQMIFNAYQKPIPFLTDKQRWDQAGFPEIIPSHSAKSTFPSPSVSLRSEEILVSIENLCLTSGFSILWKCFRKREISVSPVSSSEFYLCE